MVYCRAIICWATSLGYASSRQLDLRSAHASRRAHRRTDHAGPNGPTGRGRYAGSAGHTRRAGWLEVSIASQCSAVQRSAAQITWQRARGFDRCCGAKISNRNQQAAGPMRLKLRVFNASNTPLVETDVNPAAEAGNLGKDLVHRSKLRRSLRQAGLQAIPPVLCVTNTSDPANMPCAPVSGI